MEALKGAYGPHKLGRLDIVRGKLEHHIIKPLFGRKRLEAMVFPEHDIRHE